MKKTLKLLAAIAVLFNVAFGQNARNSPEKDLKRLQNQFQVLKTENEKLQKFLTSVSQRAENQTRQIEDLNSKISQTFLSKSN